MPDTTPPKVKFPEEPTVRPAHDEKGHSAKLTVYVPPKFLKQLDLLVKRYKYFNKGDVVRDAIMRLFKASEKWEDDVIPGSVLGAIYAAENLINGDREQQGFDNLYKNLQDRVGFYLRKNVVVEAQKMVANTKRCIEKMCTGFWKKEHMKWLKHEYGWLMRDEGGVSLLNFIDDDDEDEES